MADIFISYAKMHRSITEDLAAELTAKGFSVWWDTALLSGDSFREVILKELAQAKAAIVIWTAASVKSDWVVSEASRARARGILIPVRDVELDISDIPPPFDVLHTDIVSNRAAIFAALERLKIAPSAPLLRRDTQSHGPLSETAINEAVALEHWQAIKNSADAKKLVEFLAEFGTTKIARLGRERLSELEAAAWARLPKARTATALSTFLADFPDGTHANTANAELVSLLRAEEENAFARAKRDDTVHGLDQFMRSYPASALIEEARVLHAALLAQIEAHRSAMASDDPAELKAFLEKYSRGTRADQIRGRLRQLQPPKTWQPSRRDTALGGAALGVGAVAAAVVIARRKEPAAEEPKVAEEPRVVADQPAPATDRPVAAEEKPAPVVERPDARTASLNVNGKIYQAALDIRMPLLWALREIIGLTGTKYGCGIGQCGACTVHVEGAAVRSCSVPVSAVIDKAITTIEGLASNGTLHKVQKAWLEHDVPQCGYCQSGMIMAVVSLLNQKPKPTDADIDAAITNICRCGTYQQVHSAIRFIASA